MKDRLFEKALADVSGHYDRPEAILGATDLDHAQKVALLKQWEQDLRLLLVASEENMTGDGRSSPAETLQRVRHALADLGVATEERAAAPTKSGGQD